MVAEITFDYSYCRTIVRRQLMYVEQYPDQSVYDHHHGGPIALFAMLWVEGYLNHLIQKLFPDKWNDKESQRFFRDKYAGVKGKFEYINDELSLSLQWPDELELLRKFRNRVAHSRDVERELAPNLQVTQLDNFVDDFNLILGTVADIKHRVHSAEKFLEEIHDAVCHIPDDVVRKQISLGRIQFDRPRIGHPTLSALAVRV